MLSLRLSLCALLSGSASAYGLHVIVDPGHGGVDHGTTHKDARESEITLDVAKRLVKKLQATHKFKATLTRSDDHLIGLVTRVKIAEKAKGDVFLSIHVNSSPEAKARGAEFYFQNQLTADDEAMYLAHKENESDQE